MSKIEKNQKSHDLDSKSFWPQTDLNIYLARTIARFTSISREKLCGKPDINLFVTSKFSKSISLQFTNLKRGFKRLFGFYAAL